MIKTSICILLGMMFLTGCSIEAFKARNKSAYLEFLEKRSERLGRIETGLPSLSFDGRLMVFDAKMTLLPKGEDGTFTRLLVLYDFETQEFDLIAPYGDQIGFHSPSFNRNSDKLVMVSECEDYRKCAENIRGNQIVLYDLKTHKIDWLTDNSKKVSLRTNWTLKSKKPFMYPSTQVVRGYPIFGPTENEVIYFAGSERFLSTYFSRRQKGDATLKKLSKTGDPNTPWKEELLINDPDQYGFFVTAGPISIMRNKRLLFSAYKLKTNVKTILSKESVNAFFYDFATDQLSIAFDEANTPVDTLEKEEKRRVFAYWHMSDAKGDRVIFTSSNSRFLTIQDKGAQRKLLFLQELGLSGVRGISMSGNGQWMVLTPPEFVVKDTDDLNYFWRINLDTNERQKFPFRKEILNLIRENFKTGETQK